MKDRTAHFPKPTHFIRRSTGIGASPLCDRPVARYDRWLPHNNRKIANRTVAFMVCVFALFAYTPLGFAAPFDAKWEDSDAEGAMAVENRRGPSQIHNLAPINPGIGSPSGRLESDGGSATGNYHLDIPLISLPGRGIDLTVAAQYNTQIWAKLNEPGSVSVQLAVDGDWPVPGFNLGFGKIVFYRKYGLFIHSDGSTQVLSSRKLEIIDGRKTGRVTATFTDGSLGMFECPVLGLGGVSCGDARHVANVSLENGNRMELLSVSRGDGDSKVTTYYPVKMFDAHGNFIQIDYRKNASGSPDPPHIDRITDTVGRVVQFHYDKTTGLPTAITGPDQGSGNRVYARFYYHAINSTVTVPVGSYIPSSKVQEVHVQVLDAIYFPGNHTGYVWSDYTDYGIPKTVSVNRAMSASSDSLPIPQLQHVLDQAKSQVVSFQAAIDAAQAAYDEEAGQESSLCPDPVHISVSCKDLKERIKELLAVLNQAKAKASPVKQALATAQSAYDTAIGSQGTFTRGMMTRRSQFDYPDNDHVFLHGDLPKYSQRTDTWVDLASGEERQATTRYDTSKSGEVKVIAPDGTTTLQRTNPNNGLADLIVTTASDGKPLATTSFVWELGADKLPRQKEVQVLNHETNAMRRVEFRYGKTSRHITDEIHYDYVSPATINKAKVLKHIVTRYLDRPEYTARYFTLIAETSILDGSLTANPAYAPWREHISKLQIDLDQAKKNAVSFQAAIDAAQAAYDKERKNEPKLKKKNKKKTKEDGNEDGDGEGETSPEWDAWEQRMNELEAVLNQAKANALPAKQALATAQSAYDAAMQQQPPQTIENEIERMSVQYDTASLLAARASPTGYSPIGDPATPRGLVSRVTRWLAPDSRSIAESGDNVRGISTDFIHDETGNLRIVKNAPTGQLSYHYDSGTNYSFPSSITAGAADPNAPARITTSIMYDLGIGLPVRVTDANGIRRDMTYTPGASGWRTNIVRMSTGTKTIAQYNDSLLATTSTIADADGRTYAQTFRYDGRGLLRETRRERCTDGAQDIVEYQYDTMGRQTRQSLPRRTTEASTVIQWVDSTYDTAGRVATMTAPNGTVSQWFYNEPAMPPGLPVGAIGGTVRVVGPWGRERWTLSDALGNLRYSVTSDPSTGKVADPGRQLAEHVYDARGRLTRSQYGSQIRRFQYDSLGRLTGVTVPERAARLDIQGNYRPGGGSYSDIYQYDDQSNLVTHIDPRGVRSLFTYANDPLNRLQSVSYDLHAIGDTSSTIRDTPSTTFTYVQTGDLRRPRSITTNGVLQESYTYDAEGRPATITTKFDAVPNSLLTMSMQYDSMGRPTAFRYPERYENGNRQGVNQLAYLYSKDGDLTRISLDGTTLIDNVRYTTAGITHVELFHQGLSLSEDYTYDPQTGRLRTQSLTTNSSPKQPLLNLAYEYSIPTISGETGQITRQERLGGQPVQKSHTYDAWGRVTSSLLKTGNMESIRQSYSYDIYGNRLTVHAQQGNPVSDSWVDLPDATADGVSVSVNASNQIQQSGYLYDNAGNLVQGPGPGGRTQHYQYDAAGRLVRVEDDSHNLIEAYQYGADRRRVAVSTDGQSWRLSLWHGYREMARYDLQAGTGTLNWVDRPIYFGSRLLAELQRTPTGATLKMFHPDHRDSVVTTELTAGTVHATHQSALAFGSDTTPTDQKDGDRRFTSYRRSARTGLDYAINRDYDPKVGRFIQPDPLGMGAFNLSDPQSLNAYAYVQNDPVNLIDPLGLAQTASGLPPCNKIKVEESCEFADGSVAIVSTDEKGNTTTTLSSPPMEVVGEPIDTPAPMVVQPPPAPMDWSTGPPSWVRGAGDRGGTKEGGSGGGGNGGNNTRSTLAKKEAKKEDPRCASIRKERTELFQQKVKSYEKYLDLAANVGAAYGVGVTLKAAGKFMYGNTLGNSSVVRLALAPYFLNIALLGDAETMVAFGSIQDNLKQIDADMKAGLNCPR